MATHDATEPHRPFGTYSLPRSYEWLRQRSGSLPTGRIGHAGASIIRRIIARQGAGVYDVEIFPTIKARLYPTTNTCEKRVFIAAKFFDSPERAFLDAAVKASVSGSFVFVDVGANVGLYGLSVVSAARSLNRSVKVIAIEPDAKTRSRLVENVAFSNATGQFIVEDCGVGAHRGKGRVIEHPKNRGEHRIVATEGTDQADIEILPILDICRRHGVAAIDAIKIDVEGMDYDVLDSFFSAAPASLFPQTIIVEVDGKDTAPPVITLAASYNYRVAQRTQMNVILTRAQTEIGHR